MNLTTQFCGGKIAIALSSRWLVTALPIYAGLPNPFVRWAVDSPKMFAATAAFLQNSGHHAVTGVHDVTRWLCRNTSCFVPDTAGTRMPDGASVQIHHNRLWDVTVRDRLSFASLYVREPAGMLSGLATDRFSMTIQKILHNRNNP